MKLHVSIRPDGSVELQDENNVPQAVMCYSGEIHTALRAEDIANAVNSTESSRIGNFVRMIARCVKVSESEHPHQTSHFPAVIDGWIDHARTLTGQPINS